MRPWVITTLLRVAALATTGFIALTTTAIPASALDTAGTFSAQITPSTTTGGATATMSDSLFTSNSYTVALSADGGGTCSSGEGTIQAVADGSGNPVTVSTPGTCRLADGTVHYTLVWVSALGTTGQLDVTCVWALGSATCTPGTLHVTLRQP